MKKLVLSLLSEQGSISTMRCMSIASLLVGCVIGLYGVYEGKDLAGVAQVCAVFIGSAFIGKTAQKFGEK